MAVTRDEYDAASLRRAASRWRDADAARATGIDRQPLRDWMHRYNAEGLAGLSARLHGGGPARLLTAEQEAAVAELVRAGPGIAVHGVVRWRRVDLAAVVAGRFGVTIAERTVGKLPHRLGFVRLSVRPRHPAHDAEARAPPSTARSSQREAEAASTELAAAMQRIGELGMENELPRTRIERPGPLAQRRSRGWPRRPPPHGQPYGIRRVCQAWGVPRSSFYAAQAPGPDSAIPPCPSARPGPRPVVSEEALLAAIERDLETSPWPVRATARSGRACVCATPSASPASASSARDARERPALAPPRPPWGRTASSRGCSER